MSSSSELVLAPFKDEYKFQDLCKDLWTRKYPAARVQPYGRRGQRQHGVDVSVIDERSSLSLGIQCKAAQFDDSPLTKNELRDEVTAAKEFAPKLTLYIIATTRKTDQAIQDEANKLSADLVREGLFPVQIMSWAEILSELKFYPDLLKTYFPEFDWSALSKEQDGQLDYVRTLIHHYRASEAQRYLAIMRERAWANTEAKIQSKILTLEAHVKLLLARHSEANALLEEAFHLDPYPEERQCNYAHVCLATDRLTECRELLDRVLKQNPTNPQAFAISVMLTGRTLPLEEVISEVPEELRRNFRVAASIGDLARSAGQLDVAIAWYREATKNAPLYDCDLRAILAELLLSKVLGTHGFAAGKAPVRDDAEKIKEVENLLSNSIAGIAEEEVMAVRHPWLFNCSVANAILGSLDVARNYADRALTFEPNNSLYLSHRAKLDLSRGDGTPSEFLKRVPLSERESSDWSLLYAEALRKEGKKQDAIAILQGFLEGTQNETHRTAAYRLLVELLLEIKLYDDAHSVLNRAEAELPSRPEFLILRAKYSIAMGDRESATKLADEAANALDSDDVFYLRRSLAGVFHNLGQFGRAAKELQVLAAVSHDPSINEGILDNLLRAQDFKEALTLAQQLLLADGPSPFVSDAAASAFERTGRLGEALKICDDLLLKMPAEPAIQIRKAMLLFRMGRIAEADAILDCRFDLSKTSAASCLNLARLLGALGRYHEAIDAAYETRRRFFRSSEAHNTFMASYFILKDKLPAELLSPAAAQMDSAVLIQSLTGTTKWLVIEDREDLNPERHEFGVSHPIVAAVLGKSKGEKVQIHCGTYAPEEYEIKEIVHKYAYAAFDSMEQFAELFPGESGPLKVRLPHLDGEDSLDFGQVREIMARNAARTEESINLYKAGLLTVGAFADFINKHLLDVMWLLIRNEGLSLIALNGSTEERNQQAQCANLPSASFVLDLTAVASIVRFSSVSELPVTLRERCEVAQSSIDTLRAELSFLKSAHVGGYNMLTMVYGQLGIREVGEKDVNDQIEFFVSVLEWIERNTTVSTSGAELSVDGAVKEKLNDVIGCAFVDSALIASGGNRILVSDDCQFRALAFNEYKVQGIWSGAFIKLAFGTTDSQQQMSDYLIRAISSGYRSIPVDDALLLEAARRANWGTGSPFENVVASLRDKSWIAQTLYDVVASFFVKLWMEPIPSGRRDSIAIALVSTLAAEHNPIEVVKSLKQHISRRTRLLPLFEYEMDDVLTTWLRHQLH